MSFRRVLTRFNITRKKVYTFLIVTSILVVYYVKRPDIPQTGSKSRWYLSLFGEPTLPPPTQEEIDYIANQLTVRYTVIDNFGEDYFLASITFINTGSRPIPAKRWQIYFYCFRTIERHDNPYPYGFYLDNCGLKLFHVEGSLYRFEPVSGYFRDLTQGETIECRLKIYNTQVSRTDSFPNWYVTGNDHIPRIIISTKGESLSYVADFERPNQVLKHADDIEHPYSPEERYAVYNVSYTKVSHKNKVIPTPLHIETDEKHVLNWNTNVWVVLNDGVFSTEAKFAAENLKLKIAVKPPKRNYIEFKRAKIPLQESNVVLDEAYKINTNTESQTITITADTATGAFNGVQTLLSLVSGPMAESGTMSIVPSFTVMDAPRYKYRGLHIDVARNFHGPDQIKKVMDGMAMYKLNKLHLHLTDDEGWRLEIRGLPELIQIGSRRCHDLEEAQCLMPMLGSGPDTDTSGSGYFDIGTYKSLLKHANRLHIQIIPEIDIPGHSNAAIKSIHAESQRSHRKSMKAEPYSIIEKKKDSKVMSIQNFLQNALNPCMPETYRFVSKIMTEVKQLHEEIQPLSMFHFGADEVAKDAWTDSTACAQLAIKEPNISSHYGKMRYFVDTVMEKARAMNLAVGTWEDGVMSHDNVTAPDGSVEQFGTPFPFDKGSQQDIYVYVWKHVRAYATPHRLRLLTNYGYKVILSYGAYLYFDHPYEADPEERGLTWATRTISLQKVWGFTPSISEQDLNLNCPASIKDDTDCFKLKKPENIIGMQAQIWTETVRTGEQMDYMLFPRLLAVAERAWHKSAWEEATATAAEIADKATEYADFVNTVSSKELNRLDKLGIRYRIPPPGAIVRGGRVSFRTEFPSLEIEYYLEEENRWRLVSQNMPITKLIKIRTRSSDGKRFSRIVKVYP